MVITATPVSAVAIEPYAQALCWRRLSLLVSACSDNRAPAYVNPASEASMSNACAVRRVLPCEAPRDSHRFHRPVTVLTVNTAASPVAPTRWPVFAHSGAPLGLLEDSDSPLSPGARTADRWCTTHSGGCAAGARTSRLSRSPGAGAVSCHPHSAARLRVPPGPVRRGCRSPPPEWYRRGRREPATKRALQEQAFTIPSCGDAPARAVGCSLSRLFGRVEDTRDPHAPSHDR